MSVVLLAPALSLEAGIYTLYFCSFICIMFNYLSLVTRKPAFCICENKDADQLRGHHESDQNLCFRYNSSTYFKPLAIFCDCTARFVSDQVRNPEESFLTNSGVAQWLGRRISEQGVPGSNPVRCTFRCGLEQVTFTLLSTG